MRFKYIATQVDGKVVEGYTEAQDTAEVLSFLASKGLKPVSVSKLKGAEQAGLRKFFGQSINIVDKIFLTKYLALMLKMGTDLFQAINILIADFDKPILKAFLIEIQETLKKGQSFYSAFERYPQYFSPVFINLIKAGESSGKLEEVFKELNVSLEKERELQNKIRSALFYPSMLLVMSVAILIFLVTFAIPKIAEVFLTSGIEPPLFSQIVFTAGLFLSHYIWFVLGVLIILVIGGWIFLFKTLSGQRLLNVISSSLPIFKEVALKLALQRFANTLSALMKSGLPIVKSLDITADTISHPGIKQSLKRIAHEGVTKGLTVGEAFRKESAFPTAVSNLIEISEKAGHLDEILKTLADFYESEIDSALKNLISILEPMLLLFIGGIIGLIALAIIIPVYQLVGQM